MRRETGSSTDPLTAGIERRRLLIGVGGIALAGAMAAVAQAAPRFFVASESGTLRTVLVHPATRADFAGCGLLQGANPFWVEAAEELVAEHEAVVRRIESSGDRLLYLEEVLDSAIEEAKRRGVWASWLARAFSKLAGRRDVNAATLLGREPGGPDSAGHVPAELLRFAVTFAPELRDLRVIDHDDWSPIALVLERA